jgi:hypothetical protein
MTQALFSSNDAYRFLKVEDYFVNHLMWSKLSEVISHSYDANKDLLSLGFQQANGKDCFLLIQFIQKDTFRVRFNPAFTSVEQYPSANSRAVVMDEIDDLQRSLRAEEMFIVSFKAMDIHRMHNRNFVFGKLQIQGSTTPAMDLMIMPLFRQSISQQQPSTLALENRVVNH